LSSGRRRLGGGGRGRILGSALALLLVVGCGNDGPAGPGAAGSDSFEFAYHDSSVPPEYHRSWTVTVEADGRGSYTVDSYGEVLGEGAITLDATELDDLLASVPDVESFDDDCAGGTGRSLTLFREGEVVVDADVYACGGAGGRLMDELDEWIEPVEAQVAIPAEG
jgi:hypothetical protein